MNNKKLKSIIATFATLMGICGSLFISPVKTTAFEINPESIPQTTESSTIARTSTSPIQEFITTKIYQHKFEGQDAVTLYFQGIPLLTFLGSIPTEATKNISTNDPLLKAEQLALKLDRLSAEQANANNVLVRWNKQTKSYHIYFEEEDLINVNSQVILPDTTNKPAVDALQATNRLRRLLGNASPLKTIMGKPKVKETTAMYRVKNYLRGYQGIASWYGPGFHGRPTASGERFNQNALTAAHRYLPFGTKVKVTNVNNGRSVTVRINDRGPFSRGRIIDLSRGAAKAIGVFNSGTASVQVEIVD